MKPRQLLLPTALTAGCVVGAGNTGGGVRPTTGQELLDIQRARDAGAISLEGFERQRQCILNRRH